MYWSENSLEVEQMNLNLFLDAYIANEIDKVGMNKTMMNDGELSMRGKTKFGKYRIYQFRESIDDYRQRR